MKTATQPEMIDIQALRVGMFIHLDVGWMSHPFPLSSFRITSAAQVATIRALGLPRVRWSPEQSDPAPVADASVDAAGDDTPVAANDADGAADEVAAIDTVPAALADPADVPAASGCEAAIVRQRQVDSQREALANCQRQYKEAARATRHAIEAVGTRPQEARAEAETLTRSLVDRMIGEQDLCIRMLGEGAADKASMHAVNVSIVSLLMGRCFGFSADEMLDLGVGALLHDIGKLDQPLRMRHHDDSFSPSEERVYEEHVELGLVQGRRMGLSSGAMAIIGQHHEHSDGSGFPGGLNSDRMTMGARILALVNRYDNLCNPHLPARAMTPHESLSVLFAQGRSKFDTSILGAFIKMMGVYPPGSTVQLTDNRHALVVSVNSSRPLKPSVLVHDVGVGRDEALIVDLEVMPGLGIRRSVKPQQLPADALAFLAPARQIAYFFEPAGPVEPGDTE